MSSAEQPSAKPSMTTQGAHEEHKPTLAHQATEKFVLKASGEAGTKTIDYVSDDPQQKLQNAEDEAKGLFAKYCGCFAS